MPDGGAVEDAGETLERAAQARREAEGLRVRLDAAARHADETAKRVQEARDRLEDESEDVDRLESMSWSRIASAVRGRRSTDLERERAEREAARYQVAHAEARHDVARRDVQGLQAQLDDLGDVDRAFAEALTAQERSSSDPDLVHRLAVVAERRGALLAEDREAP
jgi:chromosome segregation ATPase